MPAVDVGTAAVLLSVLVAFAFAELVVLFAPRAMAAVASVKAVAKSIFVDVVKSGASGCAGGKAIVEHSRSFIYAWAWTF